MFIILNKVDLHVVELSTSKANLMLKLVAHKADNAFQESLVLGLIPSIV